MATPPPALSPFDQKLNTLLFRSISQLVNHPLEYAKVLIQLGYEPFPPTRGRFFSALQYPNAFQYVKYLKSVDGLPGLYRGLGPRLLGNGVHYLVSANLIELSPIVKGYQDEDEEPARPAVRKTPLCPFFLASTPNEYLIKQTCWEMLSASAAVSLSHPLHVMTVRMMGAFVGRELMQEYCSPLSTLSRILEEDGLRGLFTGLGPRLLAEALYVCIASVIVHFLKRGFKKEQMPHYLAGFVGGYTASTLTYQLHLVSNNLIVNGTRLAIGNPPHTPIYTSAYDAWTSLKRNRQLSRGASLLGRSYTGRMVGGEAVGGVWGPVHYSGAL